MVSLCKCPTRDHFVFRQATTLHKGCFHHGHCQAVVLTSSTCFAASHVALVSQQRPFFPLHAYFRRGACSNPVLSPSALTRAVCWKIFCKDLWLTPHPPIWQHHEVSKSCLSRRANPHPVCHSLPLRFLTSFYLPPSYQRTRLHSSLCPDFGTILLQPPRISEAPSCHQGLLDSRVAQSVGD